MQIKMEKHLLLIVNNRNLQIDKESASSDSLLAGFYPKSKIEFKLSLQGRLRHV